MSIRRAILPAAVLSLLTAASGCAVASPSVDGGDLPEVEIREYEGENLSSIDDFRENSIKGPQYVDESEYALTVYGLVDQDLSYTYDGVIDQFKSYRKVVTLNCVEGWDVKLLWEGVLVRDLLDEAGVRPEASIVIFKAADGYSTTLPVDYIMNRDILLAHRMNEVTLPPERGFPFQLVAESKWGYKWIKWVTEIELSNNPNIQGYWEYFGYSESGDLDKPFFD
ncbi:MAG: molybdopterin-dependent oxidoreductase [Dehalococcoidia bacterium]|nr:molybdopterin-dependent oxidoreductase [Dehalococcoidia bacterium]